jgi:hypothetical protein
VRKHGSGYYLVLHPVNPSTGRADFMAWLVNRQKEAMLTSLATSNNLVALPASLLLLPSPNLGGSTTAAARRMHNAMALRSMSKDLTNSISVLPKRQGSRAVGTQPAPPMAHVLLEGLGLSGAMSGSPRIGVPAGQGPAEGASPEDQQDPLEEAVLSKVRASSACHCHSSSCMSSGNSQSCIAVLTGS